MKHTSALVTLVSLLTCLSVRVYAEGSAQVGAAQRLQNTTLIRVDIVDFAGEAISWTGQGTAQIRSPGNSVVATLNSGESYAPTQAGVFSVELDSSQTGAWDISVSNAAPGFGRVHAQQWDFFTGTFDQSAASSASYYALVPGGAVNTDGVVELKLNGLSGNQYSIGANRTGVDGASAGRSVPTSGNSLTPQFEMYLLPPELGHYNPITPIIADFSYGSGAEGCGLITSGSSGTFSFNANVDGTYNLVCDLNGDTVFDRVSPTDLLLVGLTTSGANAVVWDGKNNAGSDVTSGNYNCKVFVSTGELHFVGRDIETSYPGLQLFSVNQALTRAGLKMFWNDSAVQDNDVNMPAPTSTTGAPTSGADGVDAGNYATPAEANSTAHSWGDFSSGSKGNNAFIDTFASLVSSTSTSLSVRAVASNADTDSDGLSDYLESCTLGTDPDAADSDNDGLSDFVETDSGNPTPIDSDGSGGINALDPDSDNDGVNDGDDNAPFDATRCKDSDADMCDDCAVVHSGGGSVGNDGPDSDGDGSCDTSDADDDNDGVLDGTDNAPTDAMRCGDSDGDSCDDCSIVSTGGGAASNDGPDADMDGQCDAGDSDDDNDGVADANDSAPKDARRCKDADADQCDDCAVTGANGSGGDTNHDGTDSDADGMCDASAKDLDGDGVIDPNDLDTDGDGIPNTEEGDGDEDGDGLDNVHDLDSDGDGISDLVEAGGTDSNADGKVDDEKDTNDDGLDDALAATPLPRPDTDGDGSRDFLNLDSDGDGATDVVEAGGGALDSDHDGRVDEARDDNHNGWSDGIDGGESLPIPDTDGDAKLDFRDVDDDDDGRPTQDELSGDADVDGDGTPNNLDDDSDGDGVSDRDENKDSGDLDGDGTPDYLQPKVYPTDTDDDGVLDFKEGDGARDADGDGIPNIEDDDDDGDGIPTRVERMNGEDTDSDGDGTPNYLDPDDDGDGIATRDEGDQDLDRDGTPNYLDEDSDGDKISDAAESTSDLDHNGIADYREPPRVGYAGGAGCAVAGEQADSQGLILLVLGVWLSARKRRSRA